MNIHQHPRTIGWLAISAFALGGANLSLFTFNSLFKNQGSFGVILMILGILVAWCALPGWIVLLMRYPNKVGGIAACAAASLKSYNPILANIVGVAYWSCTIPGISFSGLFLATAIHAWLLPEISINLIAIALVIFFVILNLMGIKWLSRFAIPISIVATILTITSILLPIVYGNINFNQLLEYDLITPFKGFFGKWTGAMAGLYIIAFSAPAFEQGLCYVGEMKDPEKNLIKSCKVILFISFLFYIVMPLIWYSTLGKDQLAQNPIYIGIEPLFFPMFGKYSDAISILLFFFNSLICLLSSLSCSTRTFFQLSEDSLIPRIFSKYNTKTDSPWVALITTAGIGLLLIWFDSPNWLIAATNFEYIIVLTIASMIPILFKENFPINPRYKSFFISTFGVYLGIISISVLLVITIFGFQQYGTDTMLIGLLFPFSGLILYLWKKVEDTYKTGNKFLFNSLNVKLTISMILVASLDAIGYLVAIKNLPTTETVKITILEDIFVVAALLTLGIGLILPARIAYVAITISEAAQKLTSGAIADFSRAMQALAKGDLDSANVDIHVTPIVVNSDDEIGQMAKNFNALQSELEIATSSLDGAREGIRASRTALIKLNTTLENRVLERTQQLQHTLDNLKLTQDQLINSEKISALGALVAGIAHELHTPIEDSIEATTKSKTKLVEILASFEASNFNPDNFRSFAEDTKNVLELIHNNLQEVSGMVGKFKQLSGDISSHNIASFSLQEYLHEITPSLKLLIHDKQINLFIQCPTSLQVTTYPNILFKILSILVKNSVIHGFKETVKGKIIIEILEKDSFITVIYSDNGSGIRKEHQHKIFKPFFTTKSEQGCLGLGLNTAFNLAIKSLSGNLLYADNPTGGVTFTLTFPKDLLHLAT